MGLEAMNGWFAFMLDPMALFIILTGGGDDRRIDKRAGFHLDRFSLELAGDRVEQGLVQTMGHKGFSKTHESRSLRCRLWTRKPAEPSERSSVVQRFGTSLTSNKSYQIDSSIALNKAIGG